MKLPFFRKTSITPPSRDYIFSLEITESAVKTSVWSVINGKVQVLSIGPVSFWDQAASETLISACDESLSDSTRNLDPTGKIQPEKVILGLPSDWISDDRIHPDRLKLLKRLTRELSLKAVGFVITPQAIVRQLHGQEGVPPTAVLVGVRRATVEITLVRLGKIAGTETVHRSDHIAADVAEGLTRFDSENLLPSRILLYDSGSDLEASRQDILSFPWQAPQHRLPFLHFPKVEILPPDFSIRAVSQSGGNELAKSIGLIPSSDQDTISDSTQIDLSPEELGFFPDIDISESETHPAPLAVSVSKPLSPRVPSLRYPLSRFSLPRIHLSLPVFHRPLLLVLPVFLIIGIFIYWIFWFQIQAEVSLTLSPQPLELSLELIADSTADQPDSTLGIITAKTISATVSADKSKSTTGSKIVGDRATGEVTLINGTSVPRLFTAGTLLTSPSGLKFSLTTSIEVASASGTADPNSYQPGKANIKVLASDIGSDSNLSAGTQFRVGSFSTLDYVARNDAAFTGGSSRQVQAVSKQDLMDLKSELIAALSETAKSKITSTQDSDRIVIPESMTVKLDQEAYSHSVDEVVDSVSLKLVLKTSGISISRAELDQLITDRMVSSLPSGFIQYRPADYQFEVKNFDGQQADITVNVSTDLLPDLDKTAIINAISGKNFSAAESYLRSLSGVSQVSIVTVPEIFSLIKVLPHVNQNIRLITTPAP